MAKHNIGSKNGMWRGGRVVASNGYVLVRVGKEHHLADQRGYAYEHRLVAETMLGRPLSPGEEIHHKNGDKADNRPENLEVCLGRADHFVHHRKTLQVKRLPGESNEDVACACGCSQSFPRYDRWGRERRFVSGHNMLPNWKETSRGQ